VLTRVLEELHARGYRASAAPIGRLAELREEYEELDRKGLLDERFARETLRGLRFEPPEELPGASSLIVVAMRDPIVSCIFRWKGLDVEVPIPPTYVHAGRKNEMVAEAVVETLSTGEHAALLNAPKKLLAVRSGLAYYGRNNITYVPEFGSFHRLTVLCTDLPCEADEWSPPEMLPACEGCTLCASACPTGAISDERFIIRGEMCITYWNEKPGGVAFPAWLREKWHHCLVGCLHCQLACPANASVIDYRKAGPSFTEEETDTLLHVDASAELSSHLREKLRSADLLDWVEAMPRNLAASLHCSSDQD